MGENIIKHLLSKLGRKVRIAAEERTMKRFNGADIDHNKIYVINNCRTLTRVVRNRNGWLE